MPCRSVAEEVKAVVEAPAAVEGASETKAEAASTSPGAAARKGRVGSKAKPSANIAVRPLGDPSALSGIIVSMLGKEMRPKLDVRSEGGVSMSGA